MSRKGFEQAEVREFLRMVAAELARLQERERFLERELRQSQRTTSPASMAIDEELVTRMLGEEAARILSTAREASTQIRCRAEESAARLLREATDEVQRLREEAELESSRRRQDATADAEAEVEMAKQQGREMVNEARAYRERVLGELARRREMARQQIEQLVHGRDRLLQAFERARLVSVDVMAELTPLGEPNEYVNLSPTTGPVPLMVPNMARPSTVAPERTHVPVAQPPADTVDTAGDATVALVMPPSPIDAEPGATIESSPPPAAEAPSDDGVDGVEGAVHLDIRRAAPQPHDPDRVPGRVLAFSRHDPTNDPANDPTNEPTNDPTDDHAQSIETTEPVEPDGTVESHRSADDLFARLRAARAQSVADRVVVPVEVDDPSPETVPAIVAPETPIESPAGAPVNVSSESESESASASAAGDDSVFRVSSVGPVALVAGADTPFARRDESLTPLIVAAARKLKRALADEQNDVLHALRRKESVRQVTDMVATEAEQAGRYVSAVMAELSAAAVSGAISMGMSTGAGQEAVKQAAATSSAADLLVSEMVRPLRTRLERCVADADGDNAEIASLVRVVYREWKTQRIDEQLDDIARAAFGRGALAGVVPGAAICWKVDPDGPACPDAEDNALAGVVCAGNGFPTDHTCAPAHSGCRCMIAPAD